MHSLSCLNQLISYKGRVLYVRTTQIAHNIVSFNLHFGLWQFKSVKRTVLKIANLKNLLYIGSVFHLVKVVYLRDVNWCTNSVISLTIYWYVANLNWLWNEFYHLNNDKLTIKLMFELFSVILNNEKVFRSVFQYIFFQVINEKHAIIVLFYLVVSWNHREEKT